MVGAGMSAQGAANSLKIIQLERKEKIYFRKRIF